MLREYPELRKILETLQSEDFLKMFKLSEDAEEQMNYLKLTKDLKFFHYT